VQFTILIQYIKYNIRDGLPNDEEGENHGGPVVYEHLQESVQWRVFPWKHFGEPGQEGAIETRHQTSDATGDLAAVLAELECALLVR
jgi:hypothetical protein